MFWQKPLGEWTRVELKGRRLRRPRPEPLVLPPAIRADESKTPLPDDAEEREVLEVTRTYSARDALRSRDFSDLSEAEIEEVRRLIDELVWKLGERRSRRMRRGRRRRIDLRRTLRGSLRHGGEVLTWSFRNLARSRGRSS